MLENFQNKEYEDEVGNDQNQQPDTTIIPKVTEETVIENREKIVPKIIPEKVIKDDIVVQSLTNADLTPEIIEEIAHIYVEIFMNDFPEYAGCLKDDQRMSVSQVYEKNFVSLEEVQADTKLPNCPCCSNQMELFFDFEATEQRLLEKFKHPSNITVLKDKKIDKIVGLTYGFQATLKEIFQHEWENIYPYIKDTTKSPKRNVSDLIQNINEDFTTIDIKPVDENTTMYCWNCVIIDKKHRGNMMPLSQEFFESIPEETIKKLDVIGETIIGTTAHTFFSAAGVTDVSGFLNERGTHNKGDYTIVVNHLHNADKFPKSFQDLKNYLRSQKKR